MLVTRKVFRVHAIALSGLRSHELFVWRFEDKSEFLKVHKEDGTKARKL